MPTPLPVIAQVYRCALEWFHPVNGQHAANVIHVITDTAGKTPLEVFTCLNAHVTAAMWDQLSSDAHVEQVTITPLDGVTPGQSFGTLIPAKWSGGSGGVTAPAVSILVKFRTLVRGRANRGRIFLPFMVGAAADAGFLAPAEQASMNTAWNNFLAGIDGDGTTPMNMVVAAYDRRHGGIGAHATAVDSALVESALATQRRRQQRLR